MDYKEKYKQAFEKAKEVYNRKDATDGGKLILESMFPELKESEDERIRKEIIRIVDIWTDSCPTVNGISTETLLAWLEKQGHDGKKWIYEDAYIKEKEQVFQDGIDEVLENPQRYGLEKQGEQKPVWSEEDEKMWSTISDLLWEGYKLSDKKVSWNKIRCWLLPKIKSLKERIKTNDTTRIRKLFI